MNKTEMQLIGEDSKDIWGKFWNLIQPYRHELWHYCLILTGSPWDAEDLVQDTVLKSFASLSALSHREQSLKPKSYLFRVATNHWLDQCRKKGLVLDDDIEEKANSEEDFTCQLEIGEVVEGLLRNLAPRQAVVFILMESFRFTAKEVADLIATTEGAVHAMLHRARKKLQSTNFQDLTSRSKEISAIDKDAIQLFIEQYNRKDFRGIANLIIDEATYSFVEMGSTEYGKETITKYSLNPDKEHKHENVYVHSSYLWEHPVLIFVEKTADGERLFDINTIEWKNGKIERWKCYYFCRDFMKHAADELKLPLAPIEF